MLKTYIQKLMQNKNLTVLEVESAINEMMKLESEAQIAIKFSRTTPPYGDKIDSG